jgi:hypothetical protein
VELHVEQPVGRDDGVAIDAPVSTSRAAEGVCSGTSSRIRASLAFRLLAMYPRVVI